MNFLNGKKTYVGVIVMFLGLVAGMFGYDVPADATAGITASIQEILVQVGGFISAIGLVHKADKATK